MINRYVDFVIQMDIFRFVGDNHLGNLLVLLDFIMIAQLVWIWFWQDLPTTMVVQVKPSNLTNGLYKEYRHDFLLDLFVDLIFLQFILLKTPYNRRFIFRL